MSLSQPIKTTIKQYIKSNHNDIYHCEQFEKILLTIYNNLKMSNSELKINSVQKILSKYSHIEKDHIIINTSTPTYNSYEEIINKIKNIKFKITPIKKTDIKYGPFSSSWIHDIIQYDDDLSSDEIQRRIKIFRYLKSIEYPAQRSPAWYAARDQQITASDIGLCVGDDHYNESYYVIIKKLRETFANNPNTYHGKKFEENATLIYEYRMNVISEEFGLCRHPVYSFLGASPDGIVSEYKNNNKNLTNLVGRMIEIKCPPKRQIKTTGKVNGDICPSYYWDQVQIQLETCDLDECDFWQCNIKEYSTEKEFIDDTMISEPFRSKKTGFEKGVLIQLLPLDNYFDKESDNFDIEKYNEAVYASATFIHPPKIEMTPDDCKIWIEEKIKNIKTTHPTLYVDKIVYWYLNNSHCQLIKRDKIWFQSVIPKLQKMWDRILFLRANTELKQLFLDYHDYYKPECNGYINEYKFPDLIQKRKKKGVFMLDFIDKLIQLKDDKKEYEKYKDKLKKDIDKLRLKN
jgi:putative phage-type endonuclease